MKRIIIPWADAGTKNVIPDVAPPTDTGTASYPVGFTPLNATPIPAGGVPVSEGDMNGVLNDITSILVENAKGYYYTFDATYAAAIGGYPVGSIIADGAGFWVNTVAANSAPPTAAGSGWVELAANRTTVATGAPDAIVATFSNPVTRLYNGLQISVQINNANVTFDPTLNVDTFGPLPVLASDGTTVQPGWLKGFIQFVYHDAAWLVVNPNTLDSILPAGTILEWSGSSPLPPPGFIFPDGQELTRAAYPRLTKMYITDQPFTPVQFTVDIATKEYTVIGGSPIFQGDRIRLSTTGSLPTGLDTTTDYFIRLIGNSVGATKFYLCPSPKAGISVAISGTQSGTHSFTKSLYGVGNGTTTFRVPNTKGMFLRGIDPNARTAGSTEKGTLVAIDVASGLGGINGLDGSAVAAIMDYTGQTNGQEILRNFGADVEDLTGANNQYVTDRVVGAHLYAQSSAPVTDPGTAGVPPVGAGSSCGIARPVNLGIRHILKY